MRSKQELIKNIMEKAVTGNQLAGLNALVLKDGEEKFYADAGYANIEEKRPFKRDTIVRLYSQSKPVTAAAAMLLIQDGIIEPYESVGDYIPSFKKQEIVEKGVRRPVREDRPMFIKDLLDMTSGLVYPFINTPAEVGTGKLYDEMIERFSTGDMMSTMEFAERLGEVPLNFQPGEHFQYGTSADVLGAVIEKASGMKLSEFMNERLFKPLNMKDTAFYVPAEKKDRFATAYICNGEDTPKPYSGNNLGIRDDGNKNAFESGGAGLFSTIDDYANFARMLMNGGTFEGKEILTRRTVEFMTNAKLTPWQQQDLYSWQCLGGFSYGNLMRIMKEPEKAGIMAGMGEYGWDGWLGPYFVNDPESRTTFLMLTQRTDYGTGPVTRKIRNVIFS